MLEAKNFNMSMELDQGIPITLVPQSDEGGATLVSSDSTPGETLQEVIHFLDENEGQVLETYSVPRSVTSDTIISQADLGNFLSRPVRIATFTWNESDPVGTTHNYNPWHLFFNDDRIKYKINNYSFIACTLKVKVLINASPFYYGAMLMSYQPLPVLTPSTIVTDTGTKYFIPLSQRPHAWIYPQANAGAEMTLPYFHFRNWLRIQKASDFSDMGKLSFVPYTTLQSANGASGQGVTVQVYAWAENVQISGPSVGLSMQAKDEYSISKVASAVAALTSSMTRIPIIGPFMTATQMGAKAVAAGAAAIGYTNVPVIADVQPLRPVAFPSMASAEIGFPVDKLTLDPKNELSIDPTILGLPPTDELSIPYLVQKESYIATTSFDMTLVPDDILFSCRVTPRLFDTYFPSTLGGVAIYQTPMCFVSRLFTSWRGDLIFRFKFIASPYHKGRVRLTYDPQGTSSQNIAVDAVSSTVTYTKVIDLGVESDVEMRIPYTQAISWLSLEPSLNTPFSTSTGPSFTFREGYDNGFITMRVLTALTAPVASAPISVLISVRGADNLEFANPQSQLSYEDLSSGPTYSYLAPQAKDEYDLDASTETVAGEVSTPLPERFLINFGEATPSLRQLLRRSTLSCVKTKEADGGSFVYSMWYNFSRIPVSFGYDVAGMDAAKGIITTANTYAFNWNHFHPLAYILPAFIGTRGSVIWTFNADAANPIASIAVQRNPQALLTYGVGVIGWSKDTPSKDAAHFVISTKDGSSGMGLTNQLTQAGLSVSLPNMSNYRFQNTAPSNSTNPRTIDGSSLDMAHMSIQLNCVANQATKPADLKLYCYAGIGTDFNAHFFLNVPTLWKYMSTPFAV